MRSGRVVALQAKAVIIATGGVGRVFPFTTNGAVKTGDGMAMAYRAGVPLKDMEFIQYHPTGLPGTGILITEGSRGEGGILTNKDGYRYLQDYNLGPPDPWPRLKGDGARPTRSPEPGVLARAAERTHHQDAAWRRSASRYSPPRRKEDQRAPADGARAGAELMSGWIPCTSPSRFGRWCTTPWAASTPT